MGSVIHRNESKWTLAPCVHMNEYLRRKCTGAEYIIAVPFIQNSKTFKTTKVLFRKMYIKIIMKNKGMTTHNSR